MDTRNDAEKKTNAEWEGELSIVGHDLSAYIYGLLGPIGKLTHNSKIKKTKTQLLFF